MPYMVKKTSNGKYHVHKKGENGPEGESLGEHDSRASAVNQIKAIYANEGKKEFLDYWVKQGEGRPTDPDDYAVVPDKDLPSTWKMPIHDRKHLGLAIAALSRSNAPHGQPAKLSPEDRKQAISRIRSKIGKLANDEDDKKAMMAEIEKHGSKGMYGDMGMVNSMPIAFIPQDDPRANYDPLGGNKSFACANCEFFNARQASCQLVCGDIVSTGYCDLWTRELSPDEMDADRAMPVRMVEKSIVEKVKEAVQEVLGLKATPLDLDLASGFKTFGPDNRYWIAYYTNNAKDLDKEWFAEKAHDRYIARLDSNLVPMPELWYWHEPIRSGKALWVDRIGHVVVAVGEFYNNPTGQSMKEFYVTTKTAHKLSHGFLYPRSQYVDGVYYDYTTFEISPLPADVAANPFTAFRSVEDIGKPMNEEKKQRLVALLGADRAKAVLGEAEMKSKELDDLKLEFKGALTDPTDTRLKAIETRFDNLLEILADRLPANKAGKTDKKKGEEGSEEEEATESEQEAEEEGDKPKKKKAVASPASTAISPELTALLNKMADSILAQGKSLKAIEEQFNSSGSATRSPYTVVPPSDPAIAALAQKMMGQGGDPNLAPGAQPMENIADVNTIFGGTQLGAFLNGNHG